MPKKVQKKLEKSLKQFIARHRGKKYWYLVPRAQYWNEQNIGELQRVLRWMEELRFIPVRELPAYQHSFGEEISPEEKVLREWDQSLQLKIFDKMVEEGIIAPTARKQSINDKLANVRNHFNLLEKLGFGYRNREGKLYISDVGYEFLRASTDEVGDLIERQLIRLQFHNPSLKDIVREYTHFRLFPYLFMLRLLQKLPGHYLTSEEFFLIVAFVENDGHLQSTAELVSYFRSLIREDQLKVIKYADPSVPMTANASVHLGLFGVTPTLSFSENRLSVRDDKRAQYLIDRYLPKLKFVEYQRLEDWYSYIGSTEEKISVRDILKYYTETGQKDAAKKLLEQVRLEEEIEEETKSLEELLEELISEELLEDALEKQPGYIEPGLKLIKKGRQYPTDVGPIDLLCADPSGTYVVVELKKGQTEDKVVGQILRYMGWVRLNLSPTKRVRGVIIGREISDKLKMAIAGIQHARPIINLKQFSLSVGGKIEEIKPVGARP